jgi:hypothetical protein
MKWLQEKLHWLPLALAPIMSKLWADKIDLPFVWPPIGDIELYLGALTSVLVALLGFFPSKLRTKVVAIRNMRIALALGFVLAIVYGFLLMGIVVPKETLHNGKVYITIGFQRTNLANTKYPYATSSELLEYGGLSEGDIEKMWTPESILLAKLLLYISYLGAMASLNYAIGAHNRSKQTRSEK